MNKKGVRIVIVSIIIILLLFSVGYYVYDVLYNHTSYQENLLKLILIVATLGCGLLKLKGGRRANLDFYEKSYQKELGSAFNHSPALRKKLVGATRFYDESKYDKALKSLISLAKESQSENDIVPVLLFMALCYTDMGLSEYAIKTYYGLLEYSPRNTQVHSNLGVLYLQEGDFEMALSHYTKAIECDETNYNAYNNRANCYFRMQDFDNAILDAKKALELKNNGVEAATLLTIIYALNGDVKNKDKYYLLANTAGRPAEELDRVIEHFMNSKEEN